MQVKTWTNYGQHGNFENASIERSDKDGKEWKTQQITNLTLDAMLALASALERACHQIMDRQQKKARSC